MNVQLFVTALWDEAKEFYHWLLQHAHIVPVNKILSRDIAIQEIKNCIQKFAYNNQELSFVPMLQCFAYTKHLSNSFNNTGKKTQNTTVYCMLLVTGVGKVLAASTVSSIASQVPVSIIKLGAVLGASSELQQGDIVFPRFFAQHDIDLGNEKKNKQYLKYSNMQILDTHISHNSTYTLSVFKNIENTILALKKKLNNSLSKNSDTVLVYTDSALCISGDSFIKLQKTKQEKFSQKKIDYSLLVADKMLYKNDTTFFQLSPSLKAFIIKYQAMLENILKHTTMSSKNQSNKDIIPNLTVIDMENAAIVQAANICTAPVIVVAIVLDYVATLKKVNYYTDIHTIAKIIKQVCLSYIDIIT